MKYLLTGFLLIAAVVGHPTPLAEVPARTYATALFKDSRPAEGIETRVAVYLSLNTPYNRVRLHLDQVRHTCRGGVCEEARLFHGIALEKIEPADVFIDVHLAQAWVHTTIPITDALSHTTVSVRVDVVWTAAAPIQCDTLPDYTLGSPGCTRTASALGYIWTAGSPMIQGGIEPRGFLNGGLPGY